MVKSFICYKRYELNSLVHAVIANGFNASWKKFRAVHLTRVKRKHLISKYLFLGIWSVVEVSHPYGRHGITLLWN